LSPSVKRAFLNLQIAIVQTIMSDDSTNDREVDAYRRMGKMLLIVQKDYEELFRYYKLAKQKKKPLSAATEQEHKENYPSKVYQFSKEV
jgi:hypothetical protein